MIDVAWLAATARGRSEEDGLDQLADEERAPGDVT
jgi:hypothetical protein